MRILVPVAAVVVALTIGATSAVGQSAPAPKAPTALSATSATRSAVSLAWTAGDATQKFVVERKALGAPWPPAAAAAGDPNRPISPSAIATVDAAAATDDKVDAFATYVYRVRAVGSSTSLSAPSNEITVGPPPLGFSAIVAAPKAMHEHDPSQFAYLKRLALDANGDPAVAYVNFDPDGDDQLRDNELAFVAWNRARYRWNAPVHVETVGDISNSGTTFAFALTRDDATGRLGLAYMIGIHELRLATSDDGGATWKSITVLKTAEDEPQIMTPAVALAAGRVHLAYFVDNGGIQYQSGMQTETPDRWQTSKAPQLPGTAGPRPEGVSVVVDGAGKPAVAYLLNPEEGYGATVAIWHPGAGVVKVADTNKQPTDGPSISVAVSGNQIGLALYANRDDKFFDNHHIWFSRSPDNGATWSPMAVVADDGGNSMGPAMNVTLDRAGHAALAATLTGGNQDGTKCGQPKLGQSSDGTSWTVCAPETKGMPTDADVFAPAAAFAANDKLYIAFKTRGAVPGIPPGLALWRER